MVRTMYERIGMRIEAITEEEFPARGQGIYRQTLETVTLTPGRYVAIREFTGSAYVLKDFLKQVRPDWDCLINRTDDGTIYIDTRRY
jgi:hypothetical protein